jgi:hypothetical protein
MRRYWYALTTLALAAGCTGANPGRDAGEAARSLVRVELSYTRAGVTPVAYDAQAHFVRYRAFDPASVPTILGLPDFDGLPLDGCKASDGTAALDEALATDPARAPMEVALLDAGRLEVRGPVDRAALLPHHYPELVPFVSGTVYGGDDTRPVALALGQLYTVSSDGGEEVGPFNASVLAPRAFPTLALDALHRGSDLELRWPPEAATAEPLLIEVRWSSRAGAHVVRCRVRDDGSFAVPHDAFDALPPTLQLQSATVTASRVSRGALYAHGAGRGELLVELRDVANLQVVQ